MTWQSHAVTEINVGKAAREEARGRTSRANEYWLVEEDMGKFGDHVVLRIHHGIDKSSQNA